MQDKGDAGRLGRARDLVHGKSAPNIRTPSQLMSLYGARRPVASV
jgi:hypothetical protein